MDRRTFLEALAAAPAFALLRPGEALAALPKATVTRVRIYRPPEPNPLFNQGNMVVTVETDVGITGVGEGGSKDTLEQCAGTLIGRNPFRIEAIWQEMYISTFSGPVMLEYNHGGRPIDYLPECLDFRNGKAYTNQRPGLGVTAEMKLLTQIGEVTEPGRRNIFRRPDGSLTHW